MKKQRKLMIPGPVDVFEETLATLGEQVPSPFTPEWATLYWETVDLLKQVFQTKANDIALFTAPGSGAVEACVSSLFARDDKVVVISNGPFANRAMEILKHFGCQIIEVPSAWGTAVDVEHVRQTLDKETSLAGLVVVANETGTGVRNPVQQLAQLAHDHNLPILVDAVSGMGGYSLPVDAWELDLVCTSSNKALEMSPGIGIVCVGPRAWEIIEAKKERACRGWYYNLSTWKSYRDARAGAPVSATTMASSLLAGLHTSLKRIIEHETLAGHWARYAWAQQIVRTGLRNIGFEMLVADADASFTVTAVCKRADMAHEQELRDFMAEKHGFTLSSTWGSLLGQASRISHMGKASTPEYLIPFLLGVEDFVRTVKEEDIPVGASLIGLAKQPLPPTA